MKPIYCFAICLCVVITLFAGCQGDGEFAEPARTRLNENMKSNDRNDSGSPQGNTTVASNDCGKYIVELRELSRDHISFLTDKISFLSLLITVGSALFGIISLAVTVIAGWKLRQWSGQNRELRQRVDDSLAASRKHEKDLMEKVAQNYALLVRNLYLQYDALNIAELPAPWDKTLALLRIAYLNAFADYAIGALKVAIKVDYKRILLFLLARISAMDSALNVVNGPLDVAALNTKRHDIVMPVDVKELESCLKNAKINARTLTAYLSSYEKFFARFP